MGTILKTEDLTCKFGGLIAVNSVNYELKKGELASIIGPNGAGKSTFYKLIVGVQKPTYGKIYFNREDLTDVSPHKRVEIGIAKSFQIVQIFPNMKVIENMAIAAQYRIIKDKKGFYFSSWRNDDSIKKSEGILDRINLLKLKNKTASSLPQGQKKCLEIGMALATDPSLLLLDEPTAGSTPIETHLIMDLIKDLSKGLTIIVVEHKMDVVMNLAKRITVMHQGKIIADGTPNEIRNNKLVKNVYLGEGNA
ncbi:ABC transporter ATP-binding protein [[Eubacterium] cellulosolvens]